jgi:hypothetical protein
MAVVSDEEAVRRYIAAAATLYASLENEKALEQLNLARKLARRVEDSVLISLYQGLIFSDNGRTEQGDAAFRAAFSLDPDAALPAKVSPRLTARIEGIREDVRKTLARVAPHVDASLAPSAGKASAEQEAAPPAATRVEPPPSSGVRGSAWIPAVAGGALLVGAGACALLEKGVESRLTSGDPSIQTPAQLNSVYQSGRTYTFVGEGLAAGGVVALAVAGGLLLWGGGRAQGVSLMVSPSSAAMAIRGVFP